MPDQRQINKKLEELFSDNKKGLGDMEEILFTDKSELQDMTAQERAEVEQAVRNMLGKKEAIDSVKPKKVWRWNFYGLHAFRIIKYLLELCIIITLVWLLLPIAINTEVTIIQASSISVLLAVISKWMKT